MWFLLDWCVQGELSSLENILGFSKNKLTRSRDSVAFEEYIKLLTSDSKFKGDYVKDYIKRLSDFYEKHPDFFKYTKQNKLVIKKSDSVYKTALDICSNPLVDKNNVCRYVEQELYINRYIHDNEQYKEININYLYLDPRRISQDQHHYKVGIEVYKNNYGNLEFYEKVPYFNPIDCIETADGYYKKPLVSLELKDEALLIPVLEQTPNNPEEFSFHFQEIWGDVLINSKNLKDLYLSIVINTRSKYPYESYLSSIDRYAHIADDMLRSANIISGNGIVCPPVNVAREFLGVVYKNENCSDRKPTFIFSKEVL
jgi:hypothetical protein